MAVKEGDEHIFRANLYGIDGASNGNGKYKGNEEIIMRSITRMWEVGGVPYCRSVDFNIDPKQSGIITRLIGKGLIIDVPASFGHENQHTFFRTAGPYTHGATRAPVSFRGPC